MGNPAATEGDKVLGVDTHFVMIPSPAGPVPTPTPMPFTGIIISDLARTVFIDGAAVALEGSKAQNIAPAESSWREAEHARGRRQGAPIFKLVRTVPIHGATFRQQWRSLRRARARASLR
jgi:hypothetical protein